MNLRRSAARREAVLGLSQPQWWPIAATVVAMATAAMAMAMATTGQWQWQPKRKCRELPRTCRSRLAGEPVRSGTHDVFD
jgi:cytochrome oxidase assembly protein ShyY1